MADVEFVTSFTWGEIPFCELVMLNMMIIMLMMMTMIPERRQSRGGWPTGRLCLAVHIQTYIRGVFFHLYPPKKYGKPRLGESMLT